MVSIDQQDSSMKKTLVSQSGNSEQNDHNLKNHPF